MIQESEYYHGAALLRAVEDVRCRTVDTHPLGVVANGVALAVLKYSTKKRPPWRFNVTPGEWQVIRSAQTSFPTICVALICGGDGVCAVTLDELQQLVGGEPGWICVRRGHHERYSVTGSAADLVRKVTAQRWPDLLFTSDSGHD
jgi:hypothetical protein